MYNVKNNNVSVNFTRKNRYIAIMLYYKHFINYLISQMYDTIKSSL